MASKIVIVLSDGAVDMVFAQGNVEYIVIEKNKNSAVGITRPLDSTPLANFRLRGISDEWGDEDFDEEINKENFTHPWL